MSRILSLATAVAAVGSLTLMLDRDAPSASPAPAALGVVETIDFENFDTGAVVSSVTGDMGSGPIAVFGKNPSLVPNAAVIFDSTMRSGGDNDLGTPNMDFAGPGVGVGGKAGMPFQNDQEQFNLLIVAEDLVDTSPANGLIDDPDDADLVGAGFEFDFSGIPGSDAVTVYSITLIDVEADEVNADVKFYNGVGGQIGSTVVLPQTGDNGLAVVPFNGGLGVSGVVRMVVDLNGSGAIDDIVFQTEEGQPCEPCIELEVNCIPPLTPDGKFTVYGKITNCGSIDLNRINVQNSKIGYLLTHATLAVGEMKEFSGMYPANVGYGQCSESFTRVIGYAFDDCQKEPVTDGGSAFCCIPPPQGFEGCTPGYWKNHPEHWDQIGDGVAANAGFTTGTDFNAFFMLTPAQSGHPAGTTMLDAISAEITGGGPVNAIGWHGIAALLNLAANLEYDLPPGINNAAELKAALRNAWLTKTYEPLKGQLSAANEAGCPLNNQPPVQAVVLGQ